MASASVPCHPTLMRSRSGRGACAAFACDCGPGLFRVLLGWAGGGFCATALAGSDHAATFDRLPTVLALEAGAPFWRQTWFLVVLGVLLTGLAAFCLRLYVQRNRLRHRNQELRDEIQERRRTEEELRQLKRELDQRLEAASIQVEALHKELEALMYSVSHDLRAPLRSVDGFSRALLEDYADRLDETGQRYLERARAGAQRIGQMIDDLLQLSRVTRSELQADRVDLSALAATILQTLAEQEPGRQVQTTVAPGLSVNGDARLLGLALEHLLNNAWKFTRKRARGRIEVGSSRQETGEVFHVRDNGVGFDVAFAGRLFEPFRRLHDERSFPGAGVGLAVVRRVMRRHGGRVWAEAKLDEGATFYFTLPGSPPGLAEGLSPAESHPST
jgi:signal transduction histidine kinase